MGGRDAAERNACAPFADLRSDLGREVADVGALLGRYQSLDADDALPFGPFDRLNHRTLESGLRTWVAEQTYLDLGYAEQLYTFGDRGRHLVARGEGPRVVSVGYLALTRQAGKAPDTVWRDW